MVDPGPLPPGNAAAAAAAALSTPDVVKTPLSAELGFGSAPAILLVTPIAHHLLAFARQKLTEGEYQIAVVLAHAACEWHTEWALDSLIKLKGAELLGEVTMSLIGDSITLADRRVRKLYGALTGDYPAGQPGLAPAPWWSEWAEGRELRHAVAHKGKQVTQPPAEAVVALVDAYIAHITAEVEKVRTAAGVGSGEAASGLG
jgi:hypothetical protein